MGFALFSQLRLTRPNSDLTPLSLRKNFSWTLMGNAAYAASRWLVLVILAKLGSPEMVGEYALAVAISMPIFAFTDLNIWGVMVTDVKRSYDFGDYLGLNILTTSIGILVTLGIVAALGYGREKNLVIILITLDRVAVSISYIFYGLFQQHERMDFIATSMLIKSGLSLALISLLAYLTGNIIWICLGFVLSSVTAFFSYDFRKGFLFARVNSGGNPEVVKEPSAQISLQPRFMAAKLMKLAWLAFPLGCVFALLSLNYNIPRYFLERYQGARALGIFAAIYAPAFGGRFILTALGNAASRRLASYYNLGSKTAYPFLLVKLGGIGLLIGVAGIVITALAGKQILHILYRAEYAEYSRAFLLLMVATAIYYLAIFMSYGITAARQFWAQIPLFAFIGTVSATACYFMVPTRGVSGAAISEIITQVAAFAGSFIVIIYAIKSRTKNQTRLTS
jgi:O-antigen/teichoic acid export membrane protein